MFCITNRHLYFYDITKNGGDKHFILPPMQACTVKPAMDMGAVILTLISDDSIKACLTPNFESILYVEENMMGIVKDMKVGEKYFKKMPSGNTFILIKTDENIIFRHIFPDAERDRSGVTMNYEYVDENITAYNFAKAADILSEKELFVFELSGALPENLCERFPHG